MSKPSFYYTLKVQFFGHKYKGWQIQSDEKTVQGEINQALETIFKSNDIHSLGSGRTDAKVHSLGHIVKIEVPFKIPEENLIAALNVKLPDDIRVLECKSCEADFRPTNDAKRKTYFYLFSNLETPSAFQNNLMANYPYELDLEKMQKACQLFLGEHDFKNFYNTGSQINTSVRTIFDCTIERVQSDLFHGIFPEHYKVVVTGNGFLKQMVRLIVGGVWLVGRGKTSLDELRKSIADPSSPKLAITAPASGLYMSKVQY